jgi:WD40 repeat protein
MVTQARLEPGTTATVDDFPVSLVWSPDSTALIVGGGEGRIYRVSAADGSVRPLAEHAPGVLQVAWLAGSKELLTAGQDNTVRRWTQSTTSDVLESHLLHRGMRWPVGPSCNSDGQRMACASGKEVLVFDASGTLQRQCAAHEVAISHLLWRGRDEILAAGNGKLYVDRADSDATTEFVLEGTPVSMALSPDLKIVANGLADGSINFRYLNNRKRSRMSGYEGKVDQVAWSANSRFLATASTGASAVVVWDFGGKGPEGSEPLQFEAHEDRIESLAWQSAGVLLASAGRDGRLALWRPGIQNRSPLDIQLLDGPAGMISWSPDGKRLAVAQASGRLRFFSTKLV